MAADSSTSKKPRTTKKDAQSRSVYGRSAVTVRRWWHTLHTRQQQLLARRPHRSFRRTRRRDYARSLAMPGYWSFSASVARMFWSNKRLFLWVIGVYAVFTIALVGISSQEIYTQLSGELRRSGSELLQGNWTEFNQASVLLLSGATGMFSTALTEAQQVYAVLLMLLMWLTVVWLLRAIFAGRSPRFRDGLYNAGAPIVPTILVGLVVLVQLVPVAIATIGFSAATASGLLAGGVEAMIFWLGAILLAVLSLYWLTSTFIALVVITLPGMRPMQALKTAGDLVIGRRLRVLLRLLWLGLLVATVWAIIMLPLILFDTWLKGVLPGIQWLPLVPLGLVVVSSLSVVLSAMYVYMLYRRIVDDESAPA